MQVSLGNVAPVDYITDVDTGLKTKHRWAGIVRATTSVTLAVEPGDILGGLRDLTNLWAQMSDEAPAWLECPEDPDFELIARRQLECGEKPDDWENESSGVHMLVPVEDQLIVPADATGTVTTAADSEEN